MNFFRKRYTERKRKEPEDKEKVLTIKCIQKISKKQVELFCRLRFSPEEKKVIIKTIKEAVMANI